jgi:hypothetical protein
MFTIVITKKTVRAMPEHYIDSVTVESKSLTKGELIASLTTLKSFTKIRSSTVPGSSEIVVQGDLIPIAPANYPA